MFRILLAVKKATDFLESGRNLPKMLSKMLTYQEQTYNGRHGNLGEKMQKQIVRTGLAIKKKQQQPSWKVTETHQGFTKDAKFSQRTIRDLTTTTKWKPGRKSTKRNRYNSAGSPKRETSCIESERNLPKTRLPQS